MHDQPQEASITESLPSVVTPYARFLEYQDRRRRTVLELIEHDQPQPADASVVSVPSDKSWP